MEKPTTPRVQQAKTDLCAGSMNLSTFLLWPTKFEEIISVESCIPSIFSVSLSETTDYCGDSKTQHCFIYPFYILTGHLCQFLEPIVWTTSQEVFPSLV